MASQKMICLQCNSVLAPATITKGGCLIEGALWLFFLLPGLIYSIWRLTSRYKACPACKSPNIIPLDSPRGYEIAREKLRRQAEED